MATKAKMFVGHTMHAPRVWCSAVGAPTWVQQIDVLAIAWSKADLLGMCEDRLGPRGGADAVAKALRTPGGRSTVALGNGWERLIAAGVIDPEAPAVYLMHGARKDQPVVRVEPDGSFATVAVWRYDGRPPSLRIEPLSTRR